MVKLYNDERLDYLLSDEEMRIIQSPSVFSYSLDAVLLAHFTYLPIKRGNILDLGTGNGVIPLLLANRTAGNITGLEIQQRLANMAKRNVEINDLQKRITIVEGDLKERHIQLQQSFYDVVTSNPPYFKTPNETEYNLNEHFTIARHEVKCTLEDVVKASKLYVKPGGKVTFVHRPERFVDIVELFRKYRLEPKRVQFVYPSEHKEANTLLIEGVRDGKAGLKILAPLYIYEQDGSYTEAARKIIYGK